MAVLYLTGAQGALGSVIRQRFLESGWTVAGFDRGRDKQSAKKALPNYQSFSFEASDEVSVDHAFKEASRVMGNPRAVISTVGGIKPWKSVTEMGLEDFRVLLDVNLTSAFLAAKVSIP